MRKALRIPHPRRPFLGHLSITSRLLAMGVVAAGLLWWGLDVHSSRQTEAAAREEVLGDLAELARRDRLRFTETLQAHFTHVRLVAASHRLALHALAGWGTEPVFVDGTAEWLPPAADRTLFPLVNHFLIVDEAGRLREAVTPLGESPPMGLFRLGTRLLAQASQDKAVILRLDGHPHLVSVSPIAETPAHLIGVTRIDSRFLAHALAAGAAHDHVAVVGEGSAGPVVASSAPDLLPPGTELGGVSGEWLVAGMEFLDYGSSEVVASFATLVPQARVTARVAPLVAQERAHRTTLVITMSALFLAALAILAWRLRRIIRSLAGFTERTFGIVPEIVEGDELRELAKQVTRLSDEVIRSRQALTEQMSIKAENSRLRLLQAVTDLLNVGVLRLTEDGPQAVNEVMERMAADCGGLSPFLHAKAEGRDLLCLPARSGGERIFELRLARSIDPGLLLVADVTERQRAEEAVHSFALFPAQNPYPVLRVGQDGIVQHANPASSELLALWDTAPGRPVPASLRESLVALHEEGRSRQVEVEFGARVLTLTMVPVAGTDYVNIYGADVTDRVVAERALAAINEELEARVAERTRALAHAKEQAELANRSKTEFLAAVSHELRTPLNAVIGFSEVMVGQLFGPLGNDRYRDYSEDILFSARHLLAVINDILDVAKIEAGQMEVSHAPVNVPEVVQAALRLCEGRARQGHVELSAEMAQDLPPVIGDRRRLMQVLVNLLSNAVKFTPEGGSVTVEAFSGDGQVVIRVSDTGIGMKPEELALALEPFRQVDGSLSRRYEGTGLGLPLAESFTRLHGGALVIDSRPGEGTRVEVRLPLPVDEYVI